jgi:cytochrome P450
MAVYNGTTIFGVAAVSIVYLLHRLWKVGSREKGLPPGPPTVPLFGNMLQMPATRIEQKYVILICAFDHSPTIDRFTEWNNQYGSIISLKVGTTTLIILNDREAIRELWEKRSQNYSDRSTSYVAGLLTDQHHAAFQSLGDSWRDRRKLISHHYSPQQCDTVHKDYQNAEAVALLKTLQDTPQRFFENTKRFAAAITGVLTYGKRPKEYEDPLCQDVVEAMGYLAENMEIGATPPVDEFPFSLIQHVPARFAYWKSRAIEHGKKMDSLFAKLWNEFIARRESGGSTGSLFDKFLDDASKKGDSPLGSWRWGLHSLQFLGGEILEGGADTTSSTLLSFFMAMACYPEAQRKAQEQIDAMIGDERSPQWSDYDNIPYVAQIQKETMRWRPVTTTGTPHIAREEDTYKGFKIPKGARTIQNTW